MITACGIATKKDVRKVQEDLEEVIRTEVRQGGENQAEQIHEDRGLAGMISAVPLWAWFTAEFLLVAGFSTFNGIRLNRREAYKRAPLTNEELNSLDLAGDFINQVVARRAVKAQHPGPGEPDPQPPLRVVK